MYLYYILLILNTIVSIKCTDYYSSTIEAYMYRDNSLCMGECLLNNNEYSCVYNWNGYKQKCHNSSSITKKYKTIDNEICNSNCGNFDDEYYEWCITVYNNWNYCNRLISTSGIETYRTYNKYINCFNRCGKWGERYYWCYTFKNEWEYCYPDKKIILFDYVTDDAEICSTPCEIYSHNKAYCYDKNKNWKSCYLNPEYKQELDRIHHLLQNNLYFGSYSENGYKLCNYLDRRAVNFDKDVNIESIATLYETNNPKVTLRILDRDNIITDNNNPILSYTVMPIPNNSGDDQLNIPLVIRACITSYTLLNRGERKVFNSEIHDYFQRMNNLDRDERGHILASQLGGPMEAYNIIPQAWTFNRGRGSEWRYLERRLDTFLRRNYNRYAEYTAILSYTVNPDNILVNRPTAVGLRIRLYIDGILSDIDENPITIETNSMENMYFTNDPNYICN
ncbi:unknown similar to AMEV109 [Mythimna separata entomopoxvirus 'L']|uniref:Type VII secretion system protein EssD-like domain-containing protein n=1 Tax=Mythimna separata entomopoxvirus 'L' TaxID=1293572 RepID=A0A916P1I8_9POXV|nr:unknown similar to AMEV109 [Mythimna separata entomopoxvirus 'L']CCU56352.1 unknown similar to AMEV109 [Mythimna separata entomopoxvirus 'L']